MGVAVVKQLRHVSCFPVLCGIASFGSAVLCFRVRDAITSIMSESEAATSSTETTTEVVESVIKDEGPEAKRRKLSTSVKNVDPKKNRLEERLGGILCCAVCLDLPRTAVYQVSLFLVICF